LPDCPIMPRAGSPNCCRGTGKPRASRSRRNHPHIARTQSACGVGRIHTRKINFAEVDGLRRHRHPHPGFSQPLPQSRCQTLVHETAA
jgi:hypothetical protein